jgi:hypothetical protein
VLVKSFRYGLFENESVWVGKDIGLMYLKLKRASGTNVAKVCIIIAVVETSRTRDWLYDLERAVCASIVLSDGLA